ncbi:hypothetical protein [Chryseobacterium sp. W4I1]|uniref:hypothetical protein n=1 Tax=Chryseobacterium sp. W4I1 TaxID=3042293 RepID=UPI002783876C|nr:hypothetical protein [Chryseobacterium sp. W4I1]MDQ0780234.1 hypothetical protein [Chryseobacterium sp. W4I1]
MKNKKRITRQNLRRIVGGGVTPAKCCTFYPPQLQAECCPKPFDMSCPPAWLEGDFKSICV